MSTFRYGRQHEDDARKEFEKQTGHKVTNVGIVVKLGQEWLAASPDGVYQDKEGNVKLLEIKCPYSCRDKSEIEVPYIVNEKLLISHKYYTQLQIQMYCCNAQSIDFFVYGPKAKPKLINVQFDYIFC